MGPNKQSFETDPTSIGDGDVKAGSTSMPYLFIVFGFRGSFGVADQQAIPRWLQLSFGTGLPFIHSSVVAAGFGTSA